MHDDRDQLWIRALTHSTLINKMGLMFDNMLLLENNFLAPYLVAKQYHKRRRFEEMFSINAFHEFARMPSSPLAVLCVFKFLVVLDSSCIQMDIVSICIVVVIITYMTH